MGLARNHHTELNKVLTPNRQQRLQELRREYSNNPIALQQIDVYDENSEYNRKLQEYKAALVNKDGTAQRRLEEWFKKYYPDV